MAEYIEREAGCAVMPDDYYGWRDKKLLKSIPAADVVPVRHGRWEPLTMSTDNGMEVLWVHAKCGCERYKKSNYCPNCGAKMGV